MNPVYLLDTNIVSEPLKQSANEKVIEKLFLHEGLCVTAAMVIYEIYRGYHKTSSLKKRLLIQEHIESVIAHIPILSYDQNAAIWHAEQQVKLSAQGKTPALIDSQIAAIAKTNNLILVTRNVKDFQYFEDLKIDNWFD
ncbi:type II toxin-antitoxin system VapC family toxin [Candidatus Albibeggiatoa sp. nov. BB20]|uniref:type II toxin-antitoxin system VapC family toxin n=1 Tax=Candidatus Albibeggiatoa sp. nov. BB20 TaxID=3162723 RepID=UPI003365529D